MPDLAHPTTLDEISPQWLTQLWREFGLLKDGRVATIESQRIGEGKGYLSVTARLVITYEGERGAAPKSAVLKLEPVEDNYRELVELFSAFEREIKFYEKLAPSLGEGVPRVYATYRAGLSGSRYILMEDLSHLHPGDQLEQMHAPLIHRTAQTIARIQAKYWNSAALDWMPPRNDARELYPKRVKDFEKNRGGMVSAEGMALARRLTPHLDWLTRETARRPHTIAHYDLREDNLIFGDPDSNQEIVIVDWQLACSTVGAIDPIRLAAGSELPEERRSHEWDVVRVWHETLLEEGVRDYTWQDAQFDTRLGILNLMCLYVFFSNHVIDPDTRGSKLFPIMYGGLWDTALAIDAGSLLP
ncbi:MAG: phosphotransferase [Verrucomicrobiota bacterium]